MSKYEKFVFPVPMELSRKWDAFSSFLLILKVKAL